MYQPPPRLVLASRSPRRRDLLSAIGFEFEVVPADVDEQRLEQEAPTSYVRRVARAKAEAVAAHLAGSRAGESESAWSVLAADTVVVVDDEVLGKPRDLDEAAAMLRRLSGRVHRVLTGVVLARGALRREAVEESDVTFVKLDDEMIDWYIATGEAMDKAGAYGIQGAASRFVDRIEGSYTNVVGLPLSLVDRLFRDVSGG